MRNGHAPAAQRWLQPQSHTSAATHMHTLQKSANMPMPLHATKTQLPSAPTVSPADTRAARAATVARFRVPWVGTMTSRSVVHLNHQVDGVLRSALRSRRRRALTCGRERAGQRGQEHIRGSDGVRGVRSRCHLMVLLQGNMRLLDHVFTSLALAR